jgi:hypothetical protein
MNGSVLPRLVTLLLVALAASSCGGGTKADLPPASGPLPGDAADPPAVMTDAAPAPDRVTPAPLPDAAPPDAPAVDAAPDAPPDVRAVDVAGDVGADVTADVRGDVMADVTADVTVDVGADLAPGTLVLLPTTHDFGSVVLGAESDPVTFQVSNAGGAPLSSLAVTQNGPDFVAQNQCAGVASLPPGASCSISVRFKPGTRGLKAGAVIASVTGQTVTATVTGNGQSPAQLAITPTVGEFGNGGTTPPPPPVTFTIGNVGDVSTGALSVAVSGADAAVFKVTSNGCLAPLSPGDSCTVTILLDAPSMGPRSATLTVSSPVGGTVTVALTGTVQ